MKLSANRIKSSSVQTHIKISSYNLSGIKISKMATGGEWKIDKGYEGQRYNIKRFAYDVLYITLSKCGFPKPQLRVKVEKENEYSHRDFVRTIHSAVLSVAFYKRDEWKCMFEKKQKFKKLNNTQKVEEYLVEIEGLPEFRNSDELDKIKWSLAFYSEILLFLNSNNINVNFGKLLSNWTFYFNKKIAVKQDPDVLLEALFVEDPDIVGYLSLVDSFIADNAIPYGKTNDIGKKFWEFNEQVKTFYEESSRSVEESSRIIVESPLDYSLDPLLELGEGTSSGKGLVGDEGIGIESEKTSQESEVGEKDLPGHHNPPEIPIETTTDGIEVTNEGKKYSNKRFAYDVLHITLSKCGFPKTCLEVNVDQKNNYRHSDYVSTVHHTIMCIAFGMRDEWKQVFEEKQKRNEFNKMQKVEEYLVNIDSLAEFQFTDVLDKIRRSLAFYSELSMFLHSNNIKVDFGKLLNVWSSFFSEKIALNEDPDALLEAIFIKESQIATYLCLMDCFVERFAIPYGWTDLSREFRCFFREVNNFLKGTDNSLAEVLGMSLTSLLESTRHTPIDASSEAVGKLASTRHGKNRDFLGKNIYLPVENPFALTCLSARLAEQRRLDEMNPSSDKTIKERIDDKDLTSNRNPKPPEQLHGLTLPTSSAIGLEEMFEGINIGSDEASKQN